jgi:putative hemolysin
MEQICEFQEPKSSSKRFSAALARDATEVRKAQRLRYRVFVEEFGASIPFHEEGLDCDEFDPHCDHLLVQDLETGEVVGTYRLLTAANAQRIGGFYSEREFHLHNLAPLRSRIIEVGRACVDPEYRSGVVIVKLWAALTKLILARGLEYAIGCGSVPLHDGGRLANSVYYALRDKCLSPEEWRVFPRNPFPLDASDLDPAPPIPALIKGYLRLGAYLCGEPAWDREFKTADLPVMLPMARMDRRYVERFLR